jgi:chromosome segregation ATPase
MLHRAGLRLYVGVSIVALTATTHADNLHQQVNDLFALSSKTSPSALQAASSYYSNLRDTGARDPRLDYAFALVLIKQQRLDDAAKKLDEFLKAHPDELHAQRARTWIRLMRRDDQAALVDLESLAKKLGTSGNQTPPQSHKEIAEFLGRALAFLEGPAASAKLNQSAATAKERIVGLIKQDELLADCERGYFEVEEQFANLRQDVTAAKADATIQQTAALKQHEEQASKDQTILRDQQEALQESREERTAETKDELAALQAKLAELQKSYTDLLARAAPLQMQASAAQTEISTLTLIERQRDGTHRVTYRNPARVQQLEGLLSQLEIQLAPLVAAATAINARIVALQQKGRSTVLQHEQDTQNLANQQQKLATKGKKLERIAKIAQPKTTGNNVRTRVLSSKITTFSTYAPFPLEAEKARILHSLQ